MRTSVPARESHCRGARARVATYIQVSARDFSNQPKIYVGRLWELPRMSDHGWLRLVGATNLENQQGDRTE